MMTKLILLAGLCLAFSPHAMAETGTCTDCGTPYRFTSVSETRSYGILIAAPDVGCGAVRFRIEDDTATMLGQTPPLAPGELAVVRMGRGFAKGDHLLTIAAVGCAASPAATRRVTFAKRSPDHGWRSASD
jgi:hypothetical protein